MTVLARLFTSVSERRDHFVQGSIIPSAEHAEMAMSQDTATRIIAVFRANQLLADTISTLPVGTFTRNGDERVPTDAPAWLEHPDPSDLSVTRVEHFSQVMWSLGLDGNSFTLALPNVDDPAELHVLDPTTVTMRKRGEWQLRLANGSETVGPDQMVHITRSRKAGALRGLSPIEEASITLGTNRAAVRFGQKVFSNGVFLSGYIAIPNEKSDAVLQQVKDEVQAQYGGANQLKPGAFTGGAEWKVPQLNLDQLQFLELQKFGKVEIATLYGIPPHLLGVTDPGAMAYASVEAQGREFVMFTIRPYVERIEAAYKRLIPGGDDHYLRFDVDGLQRADFETRMKGWGLALDHKIFSIPEVRREEDYPDQPDGQLLETPNNNAPSVDTIAVRESAARDKAEILAAIAANRREQPIEIHAPVTVHSPAAPPAPPAPNVTVNAPPPQPAPEVHFARGSIHAETHVAPAAVTVEPADVHVDVQVPAQRRTRRTIERDTKGQPIAIVEEPADGA